VKGGVISTMGDAANDLEEHGMVRTLKDLFAGAAGGIAQVLLGEFSSPCFSIVVQSPLLQSLSLISRAFRSGEVSYVYI
jgi:hypothetical protein